MNKKAQFAAARKTIYWMIAGLVITMVVIGFAMVIASYRNNLAKVPPEIRAELIALRFTNNPDCFAYNVGDKVILGTIDLNKFNEETLLKCYSTANSGSIKTFNFRLKLESSGKELTTDKYANLDKFTIFKEVLIKRPGGLFKDRLIIYVQEKVGT
jgi:hypothetical protein